LSKNGAAVGPAERNPIPPNYCPQRYGVFTYVASR
jgi:hypothetical protein